VQAIGLIVFFWGFGSGDLLLLLLGAWMVESFNATPIIGAMWVESIIDRHSDMDH